MKFSLEVVADKNYINSYGHDHIVITSNDHSESIQISSNLILSPDHIITDRTVHSSALNESDIFLLKSLKPELLIFVSEAPVSSFFPMEVVNFSADSIGVEFMPLGPACRTFNLLVAEDRCAVLVLNFDSTQV